MVLFSPGQLTALIAIADTIRTEAPVAISSLKALGITPVMLTGDNYRTAKAIAGQVSVYIYIYWQYSLTLFTATPHAHLKKEKCGLATGIQTQGLLLSEAVPRSLGYSGFSSQSTVNILFSFNTHIVER